MKQRIVTAIVGLIILGGVFAIKSSFVIALAFGLLSTIAMNELYSSFDKTDLPIDKPYRIFGVIYVLLIYISEIMLKNQTKLGYIFYGLSFLIITYGAITYNRKTLNNICVTILSILYIPIPFWCIFSMYNSSFTILFVGYIFIIAFGADTFAYFSGVFFGRRKIIPKLSPNKTLAGFIGGIAGSIILVFVYTNIISNYINIEWTTLNIIKYILFASIGAFVSQIGDLFASAIKRTNGIKDYGNLMPGHGGILDRFDSILMVAPYVYFCINVLGF